MSNVTLRKKPIGKGKTSLFLDIYPPIPNPDTGKLQRKYYLKVHIFSKPRTELEKAHNKETMELASTVAAQRQLEVQAMDYDFLSQRMRKGNFVDYFEKQMLKRTGSNLGNWSSAFEYFKSFFGEKILFPQLNETISEEYADYLLSAPAIGRAGRKISINTAVSYFAKYKATLKLAFKARLLKIDLGTIIDSITPKETHREFLFLDELQKLAETPCPNPEVKRGAIFSSLTGLRFSDVSTLDWKEIRGFKGNYTIQFSIDKTDKADYLPISDQAYELLGAPGEGLVFPDLKYHYLQHALPTWLKAAGVDKHITFHSFRHTFATLQLFLGTDIVTVSKLLGHKDIKTTMIYVKIVDSMKREAADRIKLNLNGTLMIEPIKLTA